MREIEQIKILQFRPFGVISDNFKKRLDAHVRFHLGSFFGGDYGLLSFTNKGRFVDVWIDVYDNLWTIYRGSLVRLDDGAFTIVDEF